MSIYKIIQKLKQKYRNFEINSQNKLFKKVMLKNNKIVNNDVKLGHNVMISGHNKLNIGKNVHIGTNSFIRADGGLIIGNNVFISRNVVIYTTSHNYNGKRLPFDDTNIEKKVIIEDNVWIGMNVTISPGTIIGEGSIIALGSRIYGKIAPGSIVGDGSQQIGTRDMQHYDKLKKNKNFSKEDGKEYNE